MHLLPIAQTWDGAPVPSEEQARLRVGFEGPALVIEVDAPYVGDPPPPGPPGPTDGLWSYEVVELMVLAPGERYLEVELSPHGHHWVLRLEGIRQAVEKGIAIDYMAQIEGDRWHGRALVDRRHLPEGAQRCNAYRIAGVGEQRRFFAWAPVPGERPDFHRLQHFGRWPFSAAR